jgi:hypothetical protein
MRSPDDRANDAISELEYERPGHVERAQVHATLAVASAILTAAGRGEWVIMMPRGLLSQAVDRLGDYLIPDDEETYQLIQELDALLH